MSGWRKAGSSIANGQCVEVGWRKSSVSESGNCVEAAGSGDPGVLVRDTVNRDGTVLVFTAAAWAGFTARIAGAR